MATIIKLINGVGANAISDPIKIDRGYIKKYGAIPVLVSSVGAMTANVNIEGTIATDQEVDEGTAEFYPVGAAWTTESANSITVPWTHIRGTIDTWVGGTITLKVVL